MKPSMFATHLAIRSLVAALFVVAISGVSEAAPQQLLGKSIVVRNTVAAIIEAPNGRTYPVHQSVQRVLYISTLGRVFDRRESEWATAGDRGSKTTEQSPDEKSQSVDWQFNGNDLVGSVTRNGVQTVGTISFDASFQTCHYSAQYKVIGSFRNREGWLRRFQRITLDTSSCTIQDGNAFAN